MRTIGLLFFAIFILGCAVTEQESAKEPELEKQVIQMKLTSTAFAHGEMIPRKYTCQGENFNPPLQWENAPAGAKSFALIVDDPDAPVGVWIHWLLKDIPASTREIKEDSVQGVGVDNSFRRTSYGGPCPPSGIHRYFFKLYALDVEKIGARTSEEFYRQVEEHSIEQTVLMGRYTKS